MIDAFIKGILVGLFMAISVGPTIFIIFRYSLTSSYKAGLAFVLGVSLSDIIYVTLSNVAAPLLERLQPYERYISIGGGILLMGMGLVNFLKKEKPADDKGEPATISGGHYFRIWLSGFLINTLNPGVIVTWLGIVTLTLGTSVAHRVVLFGTCLVLILGIDFLKVFLASRLKRLLTPKRISAMKHISAACIFGIGAFLLVKTIFFKPANGTKKESGIDKILSGAQHHAITKTYEQIAG